MPFGGPTQSDHIAINSDRFGCEGGAAPNSDQKQGEK